MQLRPIRGSWKINGTADAFCRETCAPDMKYSRGMIDAHPVESGYEEPRPLRAVRFVGGGGGGQCIEGRSALLESNPIGRASGALLVYREKFQRVRFTERMMFHLAAVVPAKDHYQSMNRAHYSSRPTSCILERL